MAASEAPANFALRLATPADAAAIHAVETCCFPDAWRLKTIADALDDDKSIGVVALRHHEIAGYVLAWVIAGEGEITRVGVVPEWRRCGVGEGLLTALCRESVRRGTEQLYLEVRESNIAARRLYEKFGFQVVGLRHNYYSDGEDAVVMRLDLDIRKDVRPV